MKDPIRILIYKSPLHTIGRFLKYLGNQGWLWGKKVNVD